MHGKGVNWILQYLYNYLQFFDVLVIAEDKKGSAARQLDVMFQGFNTCALANDGLQSNPLGVL